MRKGLKDFPLNKEFEVADKCTKCGSILIAKITDIDECGDFGSLEWRCPKCLISDVEIVGWILADTPITAKGKQFYPIISRANIGPCLNCGKLVIGVPFMLFSENWQLDFCFKCAEELDIWEFPTVKLIRKDEKNT